MFIVEEDFRRILFWTESVSEEERSSEQTTHMSVGWTKLIQGVVGGVEDIHGTANDRISPSVFRLNETPA